jgi:hypothetical protein
VSLRGSSRILYRRSIVKCKNLEPVVPSDV